MVFLTLCAWWQAKYLALVPIKIMAIVNAAQTNRLDNNDLLLLAFIVLYFLQKYITLLMSSGFELVNLKNVSLVFKCLIV